MSDAQAVDSSELLYEIARKSVAGIGAFSLKRLLLIAYTYLTTVLLGAAFYGYLSVFTRLRTFTQSIIFGVTSANERTLPRHGESGRLTVLLITAVLVFVTWVGLAGLLVGFRERIVANSFLQPRHTVAVSLFAFNLLPAFVIIICGSWLRADRRIKLSALLLSGGPPALTLIGVTGAIVVRTDPSVAFIWALILLVTSVSAVGTTLLVATIGSQASVRSTFRREIARDYIRYFASTFFSGVLVILKRRVVVIIMAIYLSPVSTGLFSICLIFAGIARWPLKGINQVLPPIATAAYDAHQRDKIRFLYKKTSKLAVFVSTVLMIAVIPYGKELLVIFSEQYRRSFVIIPLLMAGQYISTAAGSAGLLLLMTDNERIGAYTDLLTTIIVLPLMILLTRQHGVIGLAVAYFLSLAVDNGIQLCFLYYIEGLSPITTETGTITLLSLVAVCIIFLMKTALSLQASIILSVVVVACYVGSVVLFVLDTVERNSLIAAIAVLAPDGLTEPRS